MTTTTTLVRRWGLRALMVLAGCAVATPVQAGWQSPFELTCFRKHRAAYCCPQPVAVQYAPPVVANYAPNNCCPQYVAKSYYQPVTTYQAQTYTEPHTTYRTSYYYEPVTSYRYSYAYDPCNCSYQTVATPQMCYQIKAQTCPETTYVQKTQLVPVTQYRQMTYFEPVAPCPPPPAPIAGPLVQAPPGGSFTPPTGSMAMPPAGVQESRSPAAGINEYRNGGAGVNEFRGGTMPDSPLNRTNSNSGIGSIRNPAPAQRPVVTPRPDRITHNNEGWKPVQATLAKRAIPE